MSPCKHSWLRKGSTLVLDTILDDWLGPTLALLHCHQCSQPALLHLVGWQGEQLSERIFAIRTVEAPVRDTYLANINRDYCDLTRKNAETEALVNAARKEADIVLVTLPDLTVGAVASKPSNPPVITWQDLDQGTFETWIDHMASGTEPRIE